MVNGKGAANIIYSTSSNPVDLNDEKDIQYARENEICMNISCFSESQAYGNSVDFNLATQPGIHVPDGSVARLIDFAPGVEPPFHRAMSIDYGIVVEVVFRLSLDGGESRIMHVGDMSVNRGVIHEWRNLSAVKSGRTLFVLLDVQPLYVCGKEVKNGFG